MIKQKKCCGTGIAKGHGCGKLINAEYRIYGLGKMCCYPDWLMNTDVGKLKMQKAILKVQKPRKELEQAHKEKTEKKGITAALLITKTLVHSYVRERDKGKPCISCGTPWNSDFQAGHFYAVGSFETLRFDLNNIHGQCQQCNLYNHGNFENYSLRLPERIGMDRYNELVIKASIDKQFSKVWNLDNLKEIRENIKHLKKEL